MEQFLIMNGKMEAKIRRVRCPKCQSVLSEPSDVELYQCGGCGAKLQAKKRNNTNITVDTTSQRLDEESSRKQKVNGDFVNSTDESDQNSDLNELHSSDKDQRLLVNSSDENIHNDPRSSTEFSGHEDLDSSPEATVHNRIDQEQEQNQKQDQSQNQESVVYSTDESDQSSDYNDLNSGDKDQDAGNRAENGTVDAPPSVVEDYSFENFKMKLISYDSNQQLPVDSSDEPYQSYNDLQSYNEFSGHEEPESSPEAAAHNRIDQKQNQKQDQSHYRESITDVGQKSIQISDDNETSSRFTHVLLVNSTNNLDRSNDHNDYRSSSEISSPEATVHNRVIKQIDTGNEESSCEFEQAIADTTIVSDSDDGSKSSFRTMITKKSPDSRQKKPVYLDEDDLLSEDGSADLHRRRRFGGTSYYGYEGSVSSFDGDDDQNPRKNDIRSIRDEHVDSGNRHRFNRRKDEQQSTDVRSFYGLNEFHKNPKYRSPMIPENPKLERIELLKLVRELQDQLERTNFSKLQQVPSYYDHALNNPGRYDRRMAFSGEPTAVNRRLDGSSCHHCYSQPQERRFSAQLPIHHVCCNGPDYRANSHRSLRFSGPSSPKPDRTKADYSETDEYWQPNRVTKPVQSPRKKQYVRPVAGGSPWITCYLCSKLLQLPQSFLLFNKRHHNLKCGGCLKVLTFTLSNGTHVSRYYPEQTIVAPPSSEVGDFDKVSGSWVEPVSCSDRSFEKSYSTETDRSGSREFGEVRRKTTVSRDLSGSTRPSLNSSKISGRRTTTSKTEDVGPEPNGSPLHWLMGYASPSKVIRGS